MTRPQPNNPLHGITLKAIVEDLVGRHGWEELAYRIPIDCFLYEPTVTSSLKFLRKVPEARALVEELYVKDLESARE
ncbi:MAG: VF530 family protein [Planctomycetota bacterium]